MSPLAFELPPDLEASAPPEARGLARDEVRLLVSTEGGRAIAHHRFRDLPGILAAGDLLVVNTSGTLNAALDAQGEDGRPLALRLSTALPAGLWLVEVRTPGPIASRPFAPVRAGEVLSLPGAGTATLLSPYEAPAGRQPRLWIARLQLTEPLPDYLATHGAPIRYAYVPEAWPSSCYQTVFATEPGSAEMPSAGRAFTPEIVTRLVASGIGVAPLVLHTGVSSAEEGEFPYEEAYRVPPVTARLVNATRAAGGRVVAVGTTVVRALETVTDATGLVHPGEGWTSLVITPGHRLRAIDALLTGLHEPRATHLAMLEAVGGRIHLERAYAAALQHRYLWHEFGDLHLLFRPVRS